MCQAHFSIWRAANKKEQYQEWQNQKFKDKGGLCSIDHVVKFVKKKEICNGLN